MSLRTIRHAYWASYFEGEEGERRKRLLLMDIPPDPLRMRKGRKLKWIYIAGRGPVHGALVRAKNVQEAIDKVSNYKRPEHEVGLPINNLDFDIVCIVELIKHRWDYLTQTISIIKRGDPQHSIHSIVGNLRYLSGEQLVEA